jgi:hypothetical protein
MGVQPVTPFLDVSNSVCPTRTQERKGLPNDNMSKEYSTSRKSKELLDQRCPQEADIGNCEQAQRRAGASRE